ncbi:unnamed protein product [Mytilus edulis]|uniref:Reverse transcriptase domain-containing protein n=1 Tax=Mytilus edulis TaxID=6550 RepID=A0A8S3S491_MYTED|nr:unnamed protein product [Mytilus edulis]
MQNFVSIHNIVKKSGLYNFQGCKIPIYSKINILFLRSLLQNYSDAQVCDFLEYGWPVGHDGSPFRSSFSRNHSGATDFPDDIAKYLKKESSYKAIVGPFKANPFSCPSALSPLNSVPKKDSTERRVIVDLSFPEGEAVNSGIFKDRYLGDEISVSYPTVDDFIMLIKSKGQGCRMFKRDLKRAYRQLVVDPGDIHLLGYKWRGHLYYDRVLTMGLRSAAYICMRTTNAIAFICQNMGIDILNYLDDLAGCDIPSSSDDAYAKLGLILQNCGIEESIEKACPPSTKMMFIGILFDSENMTISIDTQRLSEILQLVSNWLCSTNCTKRELQSLLGKLNFVSQCVRSGRIFVSRLLNWLRDFPDNGKIVIPTDFKRDLFWWQEFLPSYNGISMILSDEFSNPDQLFSVDACLTGCGGWMDGRYFHCSFPEFILDQNLHINLLEMLTIVVALKLWGKHFTNLKVIIYCDNMVSVRVLNTGATRNEFLQSCLREVCWIAAVNNFELKAKHISGCDNRLPDLLSRWDLDYKFQLDFYERTKGMSLFRDLISKELFQFEHIW